MIKHPEYWLEDGSVVIIVDNVMYKTYLSLLVRLSPQFFDKCCYTPELTTEDIVIVDGTPYFAIKDELQVSKDDFDGLVAHILHDITLSDDTPFEHVLRLYIISSPSKCDYEKIFRAAARVLRAMVLEHPLEIYFDDWKLLKRALSVANEDTDSELQSALNKALYYSYTIHPDITFEEGTSGSAKTPEDSIADPRSDPTPNHISGAEAALCEHLMTHVAEHFSSVLFQPPAALHMECTDVYAGLWMERAVQPAFADNGTANPFATLRRLRTLDWKREADETSGDRSEPCDECLRQKRDEWEEEALAIWKMMDGWMKM